MRRFTPRRAQKNAKRRQQKAFGKHLRLSALSRLDTYGGAIRECALQRRDSGRLHLRFVIFRADHKRCIRRYLVFRPSLSSAFPNFQLHRLHEILSTYGAAIRVCDANWRNG
ncbi:MAG: hypothetical protein ABOK23_00880 [Candidatus Methanoperedens sp.]|nr:hypothetical protein [Candidatus Methanoperedens sp.]MCZ7395907.1 hypothetical protein [Candidatus Methanoperedens sp.]